MSTDCGNVVPLLDTRRHGRVLDDPACLISSLVAEEQLDRSESTVHVRRHVIVPTCAIERRDERCESADWAGLSSSAIRSLDPRLTGLPLSRSVRSLLGQRRLRAPVKAQAGCESDRTRSVTCLVRSRTTTVQFQAPRDNNADLRRARDITLRCSCMERTQDDERGRRTRGWGIRGNEGGPGL